MMHALGVPREDVDMTQEQPLPWRAAEVYVSFAGRAARTCKVTRHPGDLVRVELEGLDVLPGTLAEIQWTQHGRGSYAVGTVVPTPAGSGPGVYICVTESVSGIQRRLGARFEVHVPVAVTVVSQHVFAGRTEDLSTGGAHVTIDLTRDDGEAARRFADEIAGGAHVVTELTLPDGPARFTCLVAAVGSQPGDLRLRFVDVDGRIEERLAAFLREAQRTIALEQAKSG